MTELNEKKCIPCSGEVPPLEESTKNFLLKKLNPEWKLTHNMTRINRRFQFKNFKKAWDFSNQVCEIAESEFHHPDLHLGWGYLEIEIRTHKIDNLVESDFILAAKIDGIKQG